MGDPQERERFEALVLPHLDAAHNLARWLVRRDAEAEDLAQEALLRAYRFFAGFRGGDPRAWLLRIVRNVCYTWLQSTNADSTAEFDETRHAPAEDTPESLAVAAADREQLMRALSALPARHREMLVLRELEGCSYKEIAAITGKTESSCKMAFSRVMARLREDLALAAFILLFFDRIFK